MRCQEHRHCRPVVRPVWRRTALAGWWAYVVLLAVVVHYLTG